jgi:UDP-N-acetylmuramate dehydrogenase
MMALQKQVEIRGELKRHEPMSRYTTWRVGGAADSFYRPADLQDLCSFLRQLPEDEPLFWLGLGSNLLVRDGGIRGTVIATQGMLNELSRVDGTTVRAEAGVSCAKVARFCSGLGLSGVEFLAGIPGTMGGALAMNAGAFGGETWEHVLAVETVDHHGQLHTRKPGEYQVEYRSVKGPQDEWFVAAHLKLEKLDDDKQEQVKAKMKALLEKRNASQPIGLPSCGSVFRNPEGDHAARLIEASGLKGYCIGGACVSEKHANFIINANAASANDIERLIHYVAEVVEQKQGVCLQPEAHIVGEPQKTDSEDAQ